MSADATVSFVDNLIKEDGDAVIVHARDDDYDPVKRREYYLRTRKLKGRNNSSGDNRRTNTNSRPGRTTSDGRRRDNTPSRSGDSGRRGRGVRAPKTYTWKEIGEAKGRVTKLEERMKKAKSKLYDKNLSPSEKKRILTSLVNAQKRLKAMKAKIADAEKQRRHYDSARDANRSSTNTKTTKVNKRFRPDEEHTTTYNDKDGSKTVRIKRKFLPDIVKTTKVSPTLGYKMTTRKDGPLPEVMTGFRDTSKKKK